MNWFWLLLIIAVVILDIMTSNILFSWLGLGFLAAWLSGFYLDLSYQILIAFLIGFASILIGNRITKKYIRKNIHNDPILVDKIVGKSFRADHVIELEAQHKINGIYWNVLNEGPRILEGETFSVLEIRQNKLIIRKEEH